MITNNREVIAQETGGDFEYTPVPVGQHSARLISIVELGTHEKEYEGKKSDKSLIRLCWELYCEDEDTEEPLYQRVETDEETGEEKKHLFLMFKTYNNSLSGNSTLKKDLESWRGRPFTDEELKWFRLSKCLGVPAFINVAENEYKGKTYSNLSSIGRFPKKMLETLPEFKTETLMYGIGISKSDFEADEKEDGIFDILGKRTAEKIKESREYIAAMGISPAQTEKEVEDEIEKELNRPTGKDKNDDIATVEDAVSTFKRKAEVKKTTEVKEVEDDEVSETEDF